MIWLWLLLWLCKFYVHKSHGLAAYFLNSVGIHSKHVLLNAANILLNFRVNMMQNICMQRKLTFLVVSVVQVLNKTAIKTMK